MYDPYALNVWNEDRFYGNIFHRIKMFFKCVKWSYQRIVRGYADTDVWSLDWFYSKLFANTLRHLADHHCGVPQEFNDTIDENPDGWARWLYDTAHCFEEADRLEDTINLDNHKRVQKEIDDWRKEGLHRIGNYWGNLWD